jgi:uncharacterized membrane protein YbhN (UPF0104 family)
VTAKLARSRLLRAGVIIPFAAAVGALLWWRGPDWNLVGDAFSAVRWEWVVAAIGLNLLSVVVRSFAWRTVILQAMPPPYPSASLTFSAFSVGLLGNAVLPGRIGELARVAVLTRRMPRRRGLWATLVGTVFAHRLFDLVPVIGLVLWVLATAKIPRWAFTSLILFAGIGAGLLLLGFAAARRHSHPPVTGAGAARRLITMARQGLGVLHAPFPAAVAAFFQCMGWLFQLLAVWTVMHAFGVARGLPVAGLVLLLMNLATIFPLWPGNVGLLQAAIAFPLVRYGVPYPKGVAFGLGLQAIEASVGIGVGLVFLAREGLSFATLRGMPSAADEEAMTEEREESEEGSEGGVSRSRARVAG